ncbi:zinc finger protein, putative, partial [Bodo saltans]
MSRVSLYYSYIAVSNLLATLVVVDAIMTFERFFEVMVFLTSSRDYLLLLLKYSTMALRSLVTQIKLIVYLKDDGNAAPGPIRFYVDIASNFIEGLLHVCSFAAMARVALPLHLVRDLLRSLKNMKDTIQSFVRYRRLATNMDIIFDAATAEDLDKDRRCAVCYDDMLDDTGCKKLKCGHCYHKDCLRKWLEANSACPYCRKDIDANLNAPRARPHGPVPPAPPRVHAAFLAAFAPRNANEPAAAAAVPQPADVAAQQQQEEERLIQAAYAEYLRMHAAMEGAPPPPGTIPMVVTTSIVVNQ